MHLTFTLGEKQAATIESKDLLKTLQKHALEREVSSFVNTKTNCLGCGRRPGLKSHHSVLFRTPSGDVLPVDEKRGVATVCNHALGVETDGDPFTQTFYASYVPGF